VRTYQRLFKTRWAGLLGRIHSSSKKMRWGLAGVPELLNPHTLPLKHP
jgi:hypothetical protein